MLAQLIYDKLMSGRGGLPPELTPNLIDTVIKERDRIAGERSKHTSGKAPETNWGRRG